MFINHVCNYNIFILTDVYRFTEEACKSRQNVTIKINNPYGVFQFQEETNTQNPTN